MRHISIAFALSTLLLISICSAQQKGTTSQQTATSARNPANTTTLVGGPDTVVNCAQAQAGRIAMFTAATLSSVILCNSGIYEAQPYGTGAIGILNPHPVAALDVNGNINTSTTYQIGGTTALGTPGGPANTAVGISALINNAGNANTAIGNSALQANSSGSENTADGYFALISNTAGGGNTAVGSFALLHNTTGNYNTALGSTTFQSNVDGSYNVGVGPDALYSNSSGSYNVAVGTNALEFNTTGSHNIAIGEDAIPEDSTDDFNVGIGAGTLELLTAGTYNVAVGSIALQQLSSGSSNIALGPGAGSYLTSGSNNIHIGNIGTSSDSNTIRIGNSGTQTQTFVAGIYGVNVGGIPVQINSNGQLGAQTSSLRFKEQVRDMGDSTSALMKLRPVTFLYKPEYDKGERTLQYGLIAEEVAKVYPELVAYDNDGQPYSVRYQYLATMLLNEVQKQYHRADAEAKVITTQEQKIDQLEQRLSRLERLVPQTVAQK